MIKWLFKNLILPILILLAIPLIFIALIYKPLENPLASLEDETQISVLTRIDDAMETFLADETGEEPVSITMTESEINTLLLSVLQNQNSNYLNGHDYVIEESSYGYAGSWVELDENTLNVISKADIFIPIGEESFVYQTALTIGFTIDINLDTITLQLQSLRLGNLGLLWIYDIANYAVDAFTDVDIQTIINDVFSGYGSFDKDDLSVVIDVKDLLLTLVGSDEQTSTLIEEAFVFISSAELIEIGPVEDAFSLQVNLEKLRLDEPIEPFDIESVPSNVEEFQSIFSQLFDPYLIMGSIIESSLNSDSVLPYVDLDETRLNQIVGYVLSSTIENGILYELELSGYTTRIDAPVIQIDNVMKIVVPIEISNNGQSLITAIIIEVNPTLEDTNLVFELTTINLGKILIDETLITSGLSFISSDYIQDNQIIIENIDTLFGAEGITFEEVVVVGDSLRVSVNASEVVDTTVIAETIDNILDTLSNDENIPESVSESASNIIAAASSGDEQAVVESVETFIETFEALTTEEQEQLSETILNIFESSDISFDDIFGLIPE